MPELDQVQRRILEVVRDRGTTSDSEITEVVAETEEAFEVSTLTAELGRAALLEQCSDAPGCWRITDEGRAALG